MTERPGLERRDFLRAAALASLAIPLAACGGGKAKPPPAGGSPSPSPGGTDAAANDGLAIGDPMPPVRSEAVEGPEVDLERFRGSPLLINFWASGCVPCQREFPLLKGVLERHSDLPIVGVNVMDRKEAAAQFIDQSDATWPSIWDPDGSISAKFRVRVLPVTYAVGRNFTLIDRRFGELDRIRLDSMVDAILRS